jgi:hypothetical protein
MKIRHLKGDSKTEEIIDYLKKRHPLYFIANKVSVQQITDLVNRLKFKVKQLESAKQPEARKENSTPLMTTTSKEPTKTSSLDPLPSIGFKSGGALPSI